MSLFKKRLFNCIEGIGFAIFILIFANVFLQSLSIVNGNFWVMTASDGGGPGGEIALWIFIFIFLPFILGIYILGLLPWYEKWFQQKIGFYSFEGKCILILLGFTFLFAVLGLLATGIMNRDFLDLFTTPTLVAGVIYIFYLISIFSKTKSIKDALSRMLLSLLLVGFLIIEFSLGFIIYPPSIVYPSSLFIEVLWYFFSIVYSLAILAVGYASVVDKKNDFIKKLFLTMYLLLPLVLIVLNPILYDFSYNLKNFDLRAWGITTIAWGITTIAWFIGLKLIIGRLKIEKILKIIIIAISVILISALFIIFYLADYHFRQIIVNYSLIILILIISIFMNMYGLVRKEVKNM